MIIKESPFVKTICRNTKENIEMEGTICGANIKPYKVVEKVKEIKKSDLFVSKGDKYKVVKTYWGIFIHIRMEDGSQYDAIFHLSTTRKSSLLNEDGSINDDIFFMDNKDTIKNSKSGNPSIISHVLKACGVNEWVELIGAKLIVRSIDNTIPADNGFLFRSINGPSELMFQPDYHEIHV